MLRFKLSVALAACVLFSATLADQLSKSAANVRPAVVLIEVKVKGEPEFKPVGTGWLYKRQDIVVTAAHVITTSPGEGDEYEAIRVKFGDGTYANSEMTKSASDVDVAVIDLVDSQVKGHKLPLLNFAKLPVAFGDNVFTVGNPWCEDIFLGQLSTGRVINDQRTGFIVTSVKLIPGNSGGPLCNEAGEVVGLAVMVHKDDPHVSFSVPGALVKTELDGLLKKSK